MAFLEVKSEKYFISNKHDKYLSEPKTHFFQPDNNIINDTPYSFDVKNRYFIQERGSYLENIDNYFIKRKSGPESNIQSKNLLTQEALNLPSVSNLSKLHEQIEKLNFKKEPNEEVKSTAKERIQERKQEKIPEKDKELIIDESKEKEDNDDYRYLFNSQRDDYYNEDYSELESQNMNSNEYVKKIEKYFDCDPLFVVVGVNSGSAAEYSGIIIGDLILAVDGHSNLDKNGKDDAQTSMKSMLNKTTEFIIKRSFEIKVFELSVSQRTPSGLRISDYNDFEKWAKGLQHIAIVKSVHPNSPADLAGVSEGCKIVWCNGLHYQSQDAFAELLIQIKNSEDKSLIMFIKFGEFLSQIVVYPKKWEAGKGLTGMAIVAK